MDTSTKDSLYKRMILRNLYFSNIMSCADLATRINKSLPLTMRVLTELIEKGYVVETGYAPSSGGRRPLMYSIRQDMMYVVAVAMDQFVTRIVIMDMGNNYISAVEKFELPLANEEKSVELLTSRISEVIGKSGIDKEKIVGVGIGMPGFVNAQEGINYTFLNTPKGESIVDYISRNLELPVFIDKDSSLIGLSELRFGSARKRKNVMVINIGWGVGLGLIVNGELFRGNNGFAGEFSHIPLFSNGKLCSCGKTGCLETETSVGVVIEKAKEGLRGGQVSSLNHTMLEDNSPEHCSELIMNAAKKGDRFAVKLISEAGYNIGRGVAILIHVLNPELIILSGRGSLAGKIWEAPILHALNEHCIPRLATNTEVKISSLGYEAELIGAAALVMENYETEVRENLSKLKQRMVY